MKSCLKSQLVGGQPAVYLQDVELNSGPPNTNPSGRREDDSNLGPPDYKTSALPKKPRRFNRARPGDYVRYLGCTIDLS